MGIPKRKARSRSVLDIDDISVLNFLTKPRFLDDIKKELNMSHNALVLHLRRLEHLGFVVLERWSKNYKVKVAVLTDRGKQVKQLFLKEETPE